MANGLGRNGFRGKTVNEMYDYLFAKSTLQPNGCVFWNGSCTPDGYGYFILEGKQTKLHRWVYQQVFGQLNSGEIVLHSCDNPCCWRIDHLRKGTVKDNVRDMINRRRHIFGENHKWAKLTNEQRRIIKQSTISTRKLAKEYNVSTSAIKRIKRNPTWEEI